MGHSISEFEIKNSEGTSVVFNGVASATIGNDVLTPSSPDKIIDSIYIQNDAPIDDQYTELLININSELYVSIDNGVTYKKIFAGQGFLFKTKNIRQVKIKSNTAICPFSGVVTFEVFNEVG